MEALNHVLDGVLGLDRTSAHDLDSLQVATRAILVFLAGLVIMRLGNRRFLGKTTPFDVMLGFLLGSLLSRAISGTAGFLPTLAGALVIVLLHRALASIVFHVHWLGWAVKGEPLVLIREGCLDRKMAAHARLTKGDLEEALRMHGVGSPDHVALATLERSGVVTVVPRDRAVHEAEAKPVAGEE
jgi:uncharacterized membrane protein YcaP (DUF421 family)